MALEPDQIVRAPKVLLHDHLDGGLRPGTVLELAAEIGHRLPAGDADSLARWFATAADSGSLELYLETFVHTVAVTQTAPALRRVAREFVEDMVADGVVYAETRWAPSQHIHGGLSLREAVAAVQAGLDEGVAAARETGSPIQVGQLLTALRHQHDSVRIAELTVGLRGSGVVGFDIAGPENGFPAADLLPAIEVLRSRDVDLTIHAGEAYGLASIRQAVEICGANRIGHGARLIDDVTGHGSKAELGTLARYVRDWRIALELCPTSNVQTGLASSIGTHPIGALTELGLRTTVNTDNRLMSDTTLSREFAKVSEAFDYTVDDLRRFSLNAAKSAFLPLERRRALITEVIIPGFAELGSAPVSG